MTLPRAHPPDPAGPVSLADARVRQQRTGQWSAAQMAGRRWPVACVSLEVTQRCNLDCTACYLSELSEAVRDLPMAELERRIDAIADRYGAGTDVQVSGGEPTLRPLPDLVHIVERLTARGLRASLMTNGIRASRDLLARLADAGLRDVAFHVDTTQQRAGHDDEASLNTLRERYLQRARGLPLNVMFNTTVHAGNLDQVPALVAWFVARAGAVSFASFQLAADTGRGTLDVRDGGLSLDALARRFEQGAGTRLSFDVLAAGHRACNRNAVLLVANGRAHDAFAEPAFVRRCMQAIGSRPLERGPDGRGGRSLAGALARRPALAFAGAAWLARLAWRMRGDLVAARGRVAKLTLFMHAFMDARALDTERLDACVFMAVGRDGPVPMCAFNADRDRELLKGPAAAAGWQPLRRMTPDDALPPKWRKGRARLAPARPTPREATRPDDAEAPGQGAAG